MTGLQTGKRVAMRVARTAFDVGAVFAGLLGYFFGRPVSKAARASVLRLHCKTNGNFTESLAPFLRALRPPRPPADVRGFLGMVTAAEQNSLAQSLKRDGFYVFEQRLPDALVDKILEFAQSRPAIVPGLSKSSEERYRFDATAPIGKKYSIDEAEIIANPYMQQLMADPSFLAVAESYLKTMPMMADVTLWWSAVHSGTGGEDAGQFYHFDFDTPPGWLMFFFYLTDVGPQNGPHVFVRGSHKPGHPAAANLRRQGYQRISDQDIEDAFGKDNVVELYGMRGTVLAVDTRGFHKGKSLEKGHRLMAQLIYTFPQFSGAHVAKQTLPANIHPDLATALVASPKVFEKFL